MVDGQVPDDARDTDDAAEGAGTPGAGDTGGQRTPGERRRRRTAERTGQVDLDATMSHWPVVEPPTTPRPVVRPARPGAEGVATAPVLPTPEAMVVGPLLEARRAAARSQGRDPGSRRSRRAEQATGGRPAAATLLPGTRATDGPSATAPAGGTPGDPSVTRGGPELRPHDPAPTTRSSAVRGPAPTPLASRPAAGRGTGGPGPLTGRVLLLAVAALLVVLLVVVLVLVLGRGEDPAQAVVPVPDTPAQQTLALTLADASGAGLVGGAVVGVDAASVATLLLPAQLLLTVADAGEVSLEEAAVLGAQPVRRGLEDTLLLRVDGAVLLEPTQLAGLVDAVGGVVVDVTTPVVTDQVTVAVGDDQRLAGAQAAAYALLAVDGEPAEARLARLGSVLQGLLAALPADADDTAAALAAAGLTAPTGMDADELAELLAAAGARADDGSTTAVVLPTQELAAGGAALRGVDDDAARAELDARFAGALLPVPAVGEVRVLVRNGVGTPGLTGAARDLLVADGLRYAGGGNAAEFGQQPETAVLIASQDAQDRAAGEAVVRALGLDASALQVNSETLVDTDVVVVLGDDFAPTATGRTDGASTDTGTTPATTPGTTPSGEAP